jgi:membrane peptidoglycan carboxypeptidase
VARNFRARRYARKRRNGRNGGLPRWVLLLLVLTALVVFGASATAVAGLVMYQSYADELVPPEEAISQLPSGGAKIFDRNGRLLYEYVDDFSGLRQPVPLTEVSQYLIDATIATEDDTFYENPGVNIKGLLRAAYENFFPGAAPGFLEGSGGSSITQQLVKNVYIPQEERQKRSIPRKIKETVYALELSRRYSKDQILEWYLNQISYGGLYNGIEAAAQGYFGKHASELNLQEAALLAGIPASPQAYDPINSPDGALGRRNWVLGRMAEEGYVTEEEAYVAALSPLELTPQRFPIEAPHWVLNYIEPQLEQLFGREALLRDGLRVYTTLDLDLQKQAEAILEEWISAFEESSDGHNGALVAMDPNTAEILVYVGSRDYFRDDILGRNDMAQAVNSPGSAFKPFTYVTAFMELGWGPGTLILDTPVSFTEMDGDVFTPRNPAGDFKGPITVRNALGSSLNVPAFKTILYAGVSNVVETAKKMGITSLDDRQFGPSLTIGGVDVSVVDMVYGYSVFANEGVMKGVPTTAARPEGNRNLDPVSILRVENLQGEVLYPLTFDEAQTGPKLEEERIIPETYAYLISDILSDPQAQCMTFGCGGLSIDRRMAVKTGTSEPYEELRAIGDTWALGYTPDLVAGVWAGNADNSPMVNITSTSISWRALRDFMLAAHEGKPARWFERPEGLVEASVCVPSGLKPGELCGKTTPSDLFVSESLPEKEDDWWRLVKIDVRNGLLASERTPPQFIAERAALVIPDDLPQFAKEQAEEWARTLGGGTAPTEESSVENILLAIDSPQAWSVVRGTAQVIGRAESPDFVAYRLEYGSGREPEEWTVIAHSDAPVAGGVLGLWNTAALPSGIYTLRLAVEDAQRGELLTFLTVMISHSASPLTVPTPTPEPELELEPTPEPTPETEPTIDLTDIGSGDLSIPAVP